MDTAIEARLTFLCAVAVHAEIEELLPQFRRQHGIEVDVNYDVNPAVAKRVMAGEDFDVGLNNPWYVEEMIKLGLVIPDIHVPFGRVPLTIGAAGPEPERDRQFAGGRAQASAKRGFDRIHVDRNEREDVPEGHRNHGPAGSDPRSPASDGGRRAADRCRKRSSAVRHCPALEDHRRSRRRAGRDLPAGTWS